MVAQRHDYAAAVATATLRLVTLRDNDPWHRERRAAQVPPPGDWRWWLIMAGRGFGKTRTGAEFIREEVYERRARRVALVGATAADVRDVMIEGESGLLAVCERYGFSAHYEPSKRKLTFGNGAIAKTYSAEEPDRLRGPQHDLAWADEVAAWENGKDAWDQLQFGLRLGANPRGIATTTPRPVPVVKDLIAQREDGTVVVTSGSTYDNLKNLAPAFASQIIRRYEGTRLGRQEISGELLLDTPGALWTYAMIERDRVPHGPDDLDWGRIVIGVDPAVTNNEDSSETGIIVAGRGLDNEGYVVEDLTLRGSPLEWAHAVVEAYDRWRADRVIAEVNNGGLMVEQTLRTVRPNLPITLVHASRGKLTRAEPVAALYEQCIALGSLVETELGPVPVELVRDGDRVWTREGLRSVLCSGQTGVRQTVRIRSGNRSLLCTPDHLVYVQGRGFIHAGTLVPKRDILLAWNTDALTAERSLVERAFAADRVAHASVGQRADRLSVSLLSSKASATTDSLMATGGLAGIEETSCCTAPSGREHTAPSRLVGISTMSTGMPETIVSRTSRHSIRSFIRQSTHARRMIPSFEMQCPRQGGRGGPVVSPDLTCVTSAVAPFTQPQRVSDSAHRTAIRPTTIESVEPGPTLPVFDLTVEGAAEFFADGILVHNCRVHHVGGFPQLEDQMTSYDGTGDSPDRLDAAVWALTDLMIGHGSGEIDPAILLAFAGMPG